MIKCLIIFNTSCTIERYLNCNAMTCYQYFCRHFSLFIDNTVPLTSFVTACALPACGGDFRHIVAGNFR